MRFIPSIATRIADSAIDRVVRNHDERIKQIVKFVNGLDQTVSVITTVYAITGETIDGTFTGDIDAVGGFRRHMPMVWASAPSASTTYTLQPRGEISSTGAYIEQRGWSLVARSGSAVEVSIWMDGTAPPGTVGLWLEKSSDDGTTWVDLWGSSASPILTLDPTTNPLTNYTTTAKDAQAFDAGDFVRARILTDAAGWGSRMVFCQYVVEL